MLKMNQIEQIKEMQLQGKRISDIVDVMKIDPKTAKKYIGLETFSIENTQSQNNFSKLDRWKDIIDSWLDEDRRMRFKQRHTAKRVHDRLKEEYPLEYNCSYPLVQRYCKSRKSRLSRLSSKGNLMLVWHEGEAQVDFGEADFCENGIITAKKYLVLSLPASNAAYTQTFDGETAECVCRGLVDIFQRMGGVPIRIVFDNATGIGKRIGDKIQLSELFSRFKCHFGFEATFCNPYSGHEKGHVENKVGYIRRNYFVPMPLFEDIENYNESLFAICEKDMDRNHYKKEIKISILFEAEKKKLSPLPEKCFNPVRYEKVRTNKYGQVCFEGKHWYSTAPEYSDRDVVLQIGAHYIEILDISGDFIAKHRRKYGNKRTESIDSMSTISRLIKNPGAWRNSPLRENLPDELKAQIDEMAKPDFRNALRILQNSAKKYDYDTAILAMCEAVRCGSLNSYSVETISLRICSCGLNSLQDSGPDLNIYNDLISENREVLQ